MSSPARLSARLSIVVAAVAVVAVAAIWGRDGLIALAVGATGFLLLVAALGTVVFMAARGEFPPRIGRDAVEFTADRVDRAAASLETLELALEEAGARIDAVSDALAALTARVEELERRKA